jgi:hypothetical protein
MPVFRERVINAWRHLMENFALDHPIGLELTELLGKHPLLATFSRS